LYLELVVVSTLVGTIRPIYIRLWESEGKQATARFLSRYLYHYLLLGIPLCGLFILVSENLLHWLAGERYLAGAAVIPFFILLVFLDGVLVFLLAGLHIKRATWILMCWGIIAGVINVVGNLLVIPVFGLTGAASVTLAAFAVFAIGTTLQAQKVMLVSFNFSPIATMLLCTVLVF